MHYLLDTHCLIWFQENNSKIPERVMQQIQDTSNTILFSQISLFEIAIKQVKHARIEEVELKVLNSGNI